MPAAGTTERPTTERSSGLDAVRVVAIVAVVVAHVWSGPVVRAYVLSWVVPVFFLLTGYLWRPGRTVRDEVRRRGRTLLLPYGSWLVLLLAGLVVVSVLRGSSPALGTVRDAVLGGAYAGRPFSAFWFITALFVCAVLYRVMDRLPLLAQWAVAAAGVLLGAVAGEVLARLPWSVGLAVPCLVFVVAGRTLALHRGAGSRGRGPRDVTAAPTRSRDVVLGLALLTSGFVLVGTGVTAPLDLKVVDLGTPGASMAVAVLLSVGLVLVAEATVPGLPVRVRRGIVALAACGLMVVLTHAFVLWLLDTPPTGSARDALLAVVVPWAAALLVARTRAAEPLLGHGRAAQRATDPR